MKELLRIADALRRDPHPAVLATLVRAEGSSYRRVGARLLLRSHQPRLGSISGGCLEEDLAAHATNVLATGSPRTVVYDTTGENDLVWGAGLGCHGVVHVLLERIDGLSPIFARILDAWENRRACVLVTTFQSTRAHPLGSHHLLVEKENNRDDAQPDLPASWRDAARAVLAQERSRSLSFATSEGTDEVFFEFLPPPTALTLFGAGDDAQPLVRLAAELGWRVHVFDTRPAYATAERFPEATSVHVSPAHEAVAHAALDARSCVVVMTHRYLDDRPILRDLLAKPVAYLGLLGPKKRARQLLDELARDGVVVPPSLHERLHAPVGLDLGGGTPEEVALAIVAEIQATLSRRDARPLRERTRPIHLDD